MVKWGFITESSQGVWQIEWAWLQAGRELGSQWVQLGVRVLNVYSQSMIWENRQLVTDEPVEVQDRRKMTDH